MTSPPMMEPSFMFIAGRNATFVSEKKSSVAAAHVADPPRFFSPSLPARHAPPMMRAWHASVASWTTDVNDEFVVI